MADTNKTYPLAFSALAFLQPKHAKPAQLFDEDDDDETLRRLKPAPETVRAAILACKEHGFRASYSGGLAITVSGRSSRLLECFGVRLALSLASDAEGQWFEAADGTRSDEVAPLDAHPLRRRISVIALEPQPRPHIWPPRFKDDPTLKDWGKEPNTNHLWPHELRDRLSRPSANVAEKELNEIKTKIRLSPRFLIAMMDSGLDSSHLYFSDPKLASKHISNPEHYFFHTPTIPALESAKQKIASDLAKVEEKNDRMLKSNSAFENIPVQ